MSLLNEFEVTVRLQIFLPPDRFLSFCSIPQYCMWMIQFHFQTSSMLFNFSHKNSHLLPITEHTILWDEFGGQSFNRVTNLTASDGWHWNNSLKMLGDPVTGHVCQIFTIVLDTRKCGMEKFSRWNEMYTAEKKKIGWVGVGTVDSLYA